MLALLEAIGVFNNNILFVCFVSAVLAINLFVTRYFIAVIFIVLIFYYNYFLVYNSNQLD